jgi:adhesin transport system outer membrane protein
MMQKNYVSAGLGCLLVVLAGSANAQMQAQPMPNAIGLAASTPRPFDIDFSTDPVLSLSLRATDRASFAAMLAGALQRAPALAEASAAKAGAKAGLRQARAGYLPTVDLSFSRERSLSRSISNDPLNVIERLRGRERTDAIASVSQTLIDFGANAARVRGAKARLGAADAEVTRQADDLTLSAISTWFDADNFRLLENLMVQSAARQTQLAQMVEMRMAKGASAQAEQVRVQSYIASTQAKLARYRRARAAAEVRFEQVFGVLPADDLSPVPVVGVDLLDRVDLEQKIDQLPAVRSAMAQAEAADQDARALRADLWPSVAASLDAGRYGVFETPGDYDIRARITVRKRLFGAGAGRSDEGVARAQEGQARLASVRQDALRTAQIAQTDLQALDALLLAQAQNYRAARQLRDVQAERFRLARGTVLDLLAAEDSYVEAATGYISVLNERDGARYVLLARRGDLGHVIDLPDLEILQP